MTKTRLGVLACAGLLLSGCLYTGYLGAGQGSDPLVGTAVAVGASAVNRSQGGCYAACTAGTTCNTKTGYCDPLPCRGECMPGERCERTHLGDRCVRDAKDLDVRPPGSDRPQQLKLTPQ